MATSAHEAAALAAAMLSMNINITEVLIEDPQAGPVWMLQISLQAPSGLTVSWYMAPQAARELGKNLSSQALDAMTKIVPARKILSAS